MSLGHGTATSNKTSLPNSQTIVLNNRPSKNIKKSEKFFRKFQNDVETSSIKSFSTIESTTTTQNRVQSGSTNNFTDFNPSTTNQNATENKLNKSILNAHNILTNQEYSRASGIPITKKTNSFKSTSVQSKEEIMSHIDRQITFNVKSVTPSLSTPQPPSTQIKHPRTQQKAFTAQIYKKAIKSLNSKHRELQSEQENLIKNIEPSRSTSNMSTKTQSTLNTENVTIKFIETNKQPIGSQTKSVNYNSQSDFMNDFKDLKPIFSKSLANKIANARANLQENKAAKLRQSSKCSVARSFESNSTVPNLPHSTHFKSTDAILNNQKNTINIKDSIEPTKQLKQKSLNTVNNNSANSTKVTPGVKRIVTERKKI